MRENYSSERRGMCQSRSDGYGGDKRPPLSPLPPDARTVGASEVLQRRGSGGWWEAEVGCWGSHTRGVVSQ